VRTKNTGLLGKLTAAEANLARWVHLSEHRFLVDSELLGENFAADVALAGALRAEAGRLAKMLGCTITTTPSPPSAGGPGKPPTAAVCVPSSIRLEYFSDLGGKLGEYDAHFEALVNTNTYAAKCLWVGSNEKILKGVLAAAEAAGVGKACK
jgi:hypothetical protein